MLGVLETFCDQLGIKSFTNRLKTISMVVHEGLDNAPGAYSKMYPLGDAFLGKLGFKIEPAGKIRVFAMVDAWTQ